MIIVKFLSHLIQRIMSGWLLSSFYLTWYKGLWVDDYCQVFISPDTKDYEWMIIVKFLSHLIQRTMSGWLLSSFYLTWYKGLWGLVISLHPLWWWSLSFIYIFSDESTRPNGNKLCRNVPLMDLIWIPSWPPSHDII
jgi:hypothetical protein